MQSHRRFKQSLLNLLLISSKIALSLEKRSCIFSHLDAGNTYLEEQDIPYQTTWDLWQNVLGLALIPLLTLVLSYVQLRRMKLTT